MLIFQYIAKDRKGITLSGLLEAASEGETAEILHKKDLVVISIRPAKEKIVKFKGKKVKLDDLVVFFRQLATMIDAGISLVQSLQVLSEQIENLNFKAVVSLICRDIESGVNFCDALAKHPAIFSELFINMTRAGEVSGKLSEVLDWLATYLERSASLTRKIHSSLVYPAVVVAMAAAITVLLLLKVVPTFKNIFDTLGGELPLPTQILIGISNLTRKYFLIFIAMLFASSIFLKKYISTEKGGYNFDYLKLKLPVLGILFRKVALAKFSRTFSTLVRSGVSALNTLEIVAHTSGNKVVEKVVLSARNSVRDGEPIASTLSKSIVFPAMVCRMIGVGEQTGQLEKMLSKIADFYDEQVDVAASRLTSMIEPIIIALLGIVIGGIVISLFMPIFKITELIAK